MAKKYLEITREDVELLRVIVKHHGLHGTLSVLASLCQEIASEKFRSRRTDRFDTAKWENAYEVLDNLSYQIEKKLKI